MNVAFEAKSDIRTTKPDTYVIINGVRKRVTDDVSARRHQQSSTVTADQRAGTTAPATYGEGMHQLNYNARRLKISSIEVTTVPEVMILLGLFVSLFLCPV